MTDRHDFARRRIVRDDEAALRPTEQEQADNVKNERHRKGDATARPPARPSRVDTPGRRACLRAHCATVAPAVRFGISSIGHILILPAPSPISSSNDDCSAGHANARDR